MKKPLYEFCIPMRYADQDVNQHINNVSHFRFFEEGRVKFFRELNVNADGVGEGPVVAHADANFHHELHYPGNIVVRAYVAKIGNSSYTLDQTLSLDNDPDSIITTGSVTMVWINYEKKQSVPIPGFLRDVLLQGLETVTS